MTQEYQDYCNANYGPDDIPAPEPACHPGTGLYIIEPSTREAGPILVGDAASNDIAEFYHSDHATVGQTYETALALATQLVSGSKPDGYRMAWLEMIVLCNTLKEENFHLRRQVERLIPSVSNGQSGGAA